MEGAHTWVAPCGGNHPAACGRHPSTEGIRTGVWTFGCVDINLATYVQPLSPLWRGAPAGAGWCPRRAARPFPSWEGCRPQAAGWSPRRSGRTPRPNPSSLISDI
ncbi:MAG: hypothetical protein LBM98_04775 [Oscillospiraceae bacterium]|nr:hypothetical protein [Oscillospiraceae bacterium]